LRDWQDERLRERQRREVIAKHTRKAGMPPEISVVSPDTASAALPRAPRKRENEEAPLPPSQPAAVPPPAPPPPPHTTNPAPPPPLADSDQATKAPAGRRKGEYTLPPLALLDAPKTERKIDERELMEGARLLEEKCREFAVEGAVVQIHPGPVVTTYEFKPDA